MTARWKPFVYGGCLVFLGLGSAAADPEPKSLRMRTHRVDVQQARQAQKRRPLRVAQPDPTQPSASTPPDDSAPPPDGTTPAPTPPEQTPTSAPTPTPTVSSTPNLSDAELAKLAEQEAVANGGKEEVIVVTGSTIERRTLTTPSPISVLDKANIDAAGLSTIGDVLQKLPANSNAVNAQVNNGGDGATRVDIRGLGANRTLVLLNGRRVVPGGIGADASVDLNAIPLAVIERIEVLKDGASAVYGSDAIGGVVNIITRQDFDGTEATLYTGTSQKGDGVTYDLSFVTGSTSKKGNIVFSGGWQHQDPVFAGDRDFSKYDKTYDFASHEESIGGSSATPNGRLDPASIDRDGDGIPDDPAMPLCGVTASGAPKACKPNGMGGWDPFIGTGAAEGGDLYNYQPANYLFTPSQRYNAFGTGHYDLTKNTKVFFEALYLNRKSNQQLAPEPFLAATTISGQSIYNNTGGDIYDYRRRLEEFGPRASFQNIDTFRLVTGIGGKFSEDAGPLKNWKWEASYNYGHTEGLQRNEGNLILSRLANALGPSFIDADGVPRCGTPGNEIAGCSPMNIMGKSGSIDKAARDYVTFTGVSTGFNDQKTALLQTSGRLAKLPNGGDISLALGGDYRREAGGFTPDPLTSTGDTTGNAQAPTGGSYNAFEAFGEVSIVPVSGQKLAEWVELNLAARAYRYNTFGSGVTWKAGGLFKTIGGLAARGTYSTAFRAPSVGELFAGKADDFPTASDPCDASDGPLDPASVAAKRCKAEGLDDTFMPGSSQQRARVGGNPKLEAETAKVFTAGLVYESPQLKGLSVTLDYFNIKIEKAIQSLGAQVILANCYTRDQDDACAQIHRKSSTGAIDFIDDPTLNVGATNTDGIDYAINYDYKHEGAGHFHHQLEGQWLHAIDLDNSIQILHGLGVYDLGAYPKWKTNFSTMWDKGGLNAGFNVRIIGSFAECDNNDCNSVDDAGVRINGTRTVERNYTGDVYVGYAVKGSQGTTRVQLGVNNVTNANPSLIYVGFAGDSDSSTYDYMGRFFYARMSQLF